MDFEFFESLSQEKAKKFLENFLNVEKEKVSEMINDAQKEGIIADFSITSISIVFKWLVKKLKIIPHTPDTELPEWIRKCDSYIQNLFDFDETSSIIVLRAAYYLGESFVRNYPKLHWTTGDRNYAEQNMPVIAGFKKGIEMAPILISENIFRSIHSKLDNEDCIDVAVNGWVSFVK
jgi:hypothetical protein